MTHIQSDTEMKPGDLIEIFRGTFKHWAIYIGGNKVVHLVTQNNDSVLVELFRIFETRKGEVRLENLQEVVDGDRFRVNNLLDDKYEHREPYKIVRDACRMVGSQVEYEVTTYNCEHFVTNLRYGKPESRQVKVAEIAGGVAIGVIALGALAALGAVLSSSLSNTNEDEDNHRVRQRNSRRSRNRHWQR